MKIEKLNENKIRITFNTTYLQKNNVDIHSFMANSIESQSLFLNMLDEAEKEVGFISDNYKLSIEAIALSNGTFILTVTRIEKENLKSVRVQARRKSNCPESNFVIYKFLSFDDFCNFKNFLGISAPELSENISNSNLLYKYDNCFFLILQNISSEYICKIAGIISEFADFVGSSDLIMGKIKECGLLVNKNIIHTN